MPVLTARLKQAVWIIALAMVFLLITAIFLELFLRLYYTHYGSRDQQIMYLYSREEIRALDAQFVPMPYVTYLPNPAFEGHNTLGYRGAEVALPKPSGVFRIVALGGSTTYSSATSAEDAYPAQLQKILNEDYGLSHVEVVNAGVSGFTSWEMLINFEFRALELEPDLIILYEAVNDLVPREHISADCYRGNNLLRGLNGARGFWIERDSPLSPSVLYRVIALNVGWMDNPLHLDSTFELPSAGCAPDSGARAERLANNPPVYFERNYRSLIAVAQANGVQVLLSTWAYDVNNAERDDLWREGIAQHNAITRRLAAEMDVPLLDLAASYPVDGSLWTTDGIHMNKDGAHEQARQYAEFLIDKDLLQCPPSPYPPSPPNYTGKMTPSRGNPIR